MNNKIMNNKIMIIKTNKKIISSYHNKLICQVNHRICFRTILNNLLNYVFYI